MKLFRKSPWSSRATRASISNNDKNEFIFLSVGREFTSTDELFVWFRVKYGMLMYAYRSGHTTSNFFFFSILYAYRTFLYK